MGKQERKRFKAPWTKKRLNQLLVFEKLLSECQSINSANNCITRLSRIIDLAKQLERFDLDGRTISFKQMLRDLAYEQFRKDQP